MPNKYSAITITVAKNRKGPGCVHCNFEGEVLFFIDRPGGPPGNQRMPCPKCYKDEKSCSAAVRDALDDLKNLDGG